MERQLEVRNTDFPPREPRFDSKHPHGGPSPSVTPVLGDLMTSSGNRRHADKTLIHICVNICILLSLSLSVFHIIKFPVNPHDLFSTFFLLQWICSDPDSSVHEVTMVLANAISKPH